MKVKNLQILELASVLAGPTVGTFFAEMGAKVIKVENPKSAGDITRQWKMPGEHPESKISAYYAAANTNKQIEFLDLETDGDFQSVIDKIRASDIVLVNFKPGDAEKFKLTYQDCLRYHPNIIYGEITGYGPNNKRSAFDIVLQAETGYLSINGAKEHPSKLPVAFIDLFAAHQLKAGILVALLEQKMPCKVSVSLFDAAVASLANQATNTLMNRFTPSRMGMLHPNIAPYGEIIKCEDGIEFVLAIGTERQFLRLINLLQIPKDQAFSTNAKRVNNRAKLHKRLQEKASNFKGSDFEQSCFKHEIPIGRIRNLKELFQLPEANRLVIQEEVENRRTKKVRTSIFTISA